MHQIHVSLTTIRARLASVHRVVESLLAQQFERGHFNVNLYLSREPYLLDEGCPTPTPELESLVKRHVGRFTFEYVRNTGPYRKIFPILDKVYALPQIAFMRSLIVTVDDDTLYPPDWLQGLYSAYLRHSCVTGYRGRTLMMADDKIAPYHLWSRTVQENPSARNVLTGKDGILYSPLHLHPHARNERAALRVAPKADDLWLKTHALLLGVPAQAIHGSLASEFPSITPPADDISLYQAFNRRGGNDEAIEAINHHLRDTYDISLQGLAHGARPSVTLVLSI
jgi:hypothetical protein